MSKRPLEHPRGRGAWSNPENRFEALAREDFDDGWGTRERNAGETALRTELIRDSSRSAINYNRSPDVPFDRSINPYRGCEHGCVYCFARPTHAYLGYSPGLDFESRILYKPEAPNLLRAELRRRGYECEPIAVGINTDGYQPVERRLGLTRAVLEVLQEARHPCTIVTKSALVERDIDILAEMAAEGLVSVALSITTLDPRLARGMEPRATAPHRRLEAMAKLAAAGIPVGIMVAPLIPVLIDGETETLLERGREAGASYAGYVLMRLPHEVSGLFREWLADVEPGKADHVMARIRDSRGGRDYDSRFGERMRGSGVFADLIHQRFRAASKRLGFGRGPELRTDRFRPPRAAGDEQMDLF